MSSATHVSSSALLLPKTLANYASQKPESSESEDLDGAQPDNPSSVAGSENEFPDGHGTANPIKTDVSAKRVPKSYTAQEVTEHNSETNLWIIVGSDVYDVTEFQHQHPGGAKVMRGVAGTDATKKFDKHHRRGILEPYKPKYQVGVLATASKSKAGRDQAGTVAPKRKGGLL
ncbi:cytochrome c1 heme lyase, partial [Apiospora marii]